MYSITAYLHSSKIARSLATIFVNCKSNAVFVMTHESQEMSQCCSGPFCRCQRNCSLSLEYSKNQAGLLCSGPAAAAVSEDGTTCDLNFSVRSRHAASMSLCLARRTSDPEAKIGFLEVALDPLVNKTGDMATATKPPVEQCQSLSASSLKNVWPTVTSQCHTNGIQCPLTLAHHKHEA